MAVASEPYAPSVLVSTENLPEKEWLEYRRRGIGGSDAAAILGISPFATARDLYYDKLKIVPFDDSESNWVAKKMGHLLEDLVAEIFHVKTGYRIYQIKKMFYHPVHTFMLADIDYFVELPGGRTAILEIKTTNYNAKDHWWSEDGQEIVPLNYEAQGRHYMAVMNIDEVFYCCLYGNNEDEVIIRHIDRDRDYEAELIALEQDFWENHILTGTPPPYTEDGDLILNSVRRHFGPADPSAPELILEGNMALLVPRYPYVSRIVGPDPKYRFARKFLQYQWPPKTPKGRRFDVELPGDGVYEVGIKRWNADKTLLLERQVYWLLLLDGNEYTIPKWQVLPLVEALRSGMLGA